MYKRLYQRPLVLLATVGIAALLAVFPGAASSQDVSQDNAHFSFNEFVIGVAVSSATLSQVMSGPLTINLPEGAMGSSFSTGDITSVTVGPNTGNTVTNLNTGIANQGAAIAVSAIISIPETAGATAMATSLGMGATGTSAP